MFGKKLVDLLTVSATISMLLPAISFGANLEVKQEGYHYQMPLTQNVYTETFVISPIPKPGPEKENQVLESTSAPPVALFTNPIVVYFKIDSAKIDPDQARKLSSELKELEVPQTTPLAVTGYTCRKGSNQLNQWLSNERAIAVAKLLQKEGFTVAKIEGKGDSEQVNKKYFPINRRVEIKAIKE